MDGKIPSGPTFAYSVINKICLSCVAYGIVSIHNRMTYVTNEVLTSKHECVTAKYVSALDMTKNLAYCK
jgi:hypothetical protein